MTQRKAEKVTGLEIRDLGGGKWGAYDGGVLAAEAKHYQPSIALTYLVNAVYKIRQREVFERDGWMCKYCGSSRNLQTDHRVNRSKDRNDRADNLDTVCWVCHEKITKGRMKRQ